MGAWAGRFSFKGQTMSVEEERCLRELVKQRLCITQISQVIGKPRLCVKAKVYNLGLSLEVAAATAATRCHEPAAATTTPAHIIHPSASNNPLSKDSSSKTDLSAAQLRTDERLPSVGSRLRFLDAALVALEKPGLGMAEVSRLNKIILGVKVYQELFALYEYYRALKINFWT